MLVRKFNKSQFTYCYTISLSLSLSLDYNKFDNHLKLLDLLFIIKSKDYFEGSQSSAMTQS